MRSDTAPEGGTVMAAPAYHDQLVEDVLVVHDELDVPEGHKAEVIEGRIVLSPTPTPRHGLIFTRLARQIGRLLPDNMDHTNNITLEMPATRERYIPDLVVMSVDKLESDNWLCQAKDAKLVAEIVSPSNARDDRVIKVRGYAASGVPIYLLIDPLEKEVTLFTEPAGECYRQAHRVPFGAVIALPEPYDAEIDTSVFNTRP